MGEVSTDVRRGDVVIVELDPTKGSEQQGTRPCLVVQSDVGNENAPTTIVVPCSTAFDDELYPFEVLVEEDESALEADTAVQCNQIRTVSIEHRIRDNVGSVPAERMNDVNRALEYSLGLAGPD